MLLKLDFDSAIPIYEQLRRQIIIAIAEGKLKPGEGLPSVRQLSGDIGINLHTVNKTYKILKEEGYLLIDERKGASVKEKGPFKSDEFETILANEIHLITADAKNRGINEIEFLKLCSSFYKEYEKGE